MVLAYCILIPFQMHQYSWVGPKDSGNFTQPHNSHKTCMRTSENNRHNPEGQSGKTQKPTQNTTKASTPLHNIQQHKSNIQSANMFAHSIQGIFKGPNLVSIQITVILFQQRELTHSTNKPKIHKTTPQSAIFRKSCRKETEKCSLFFV